MKIDVGIIGATGYVGLELYRLLSNHRNVNIVALGSSSFSDKSLNEIYPNIGKDGNVKLIKNEDVIKYSDIVFMALPHGVSEKYAIEALNSGKKVIDLGADFRIKDSEIYKKWYGIDFIDKEIHKKAVYGLSEIYRDYIINSDLIANPGCYPTSILLPLIPLTKFGLIETNDIIVDSKSGLTGAGRALSQKSHFIDANENISPYNIGAHRHIPEIEQYLKEIDENIGLVFTTTLTPVNRGILSTIYCNVKEGISLENIHDKLTEYYKNNVFIEILEIGKTVDLKSSRFTNKCVISIHENNKKLVICSSIDNMIKGAAGQAVQNMNLMYGFGESEGLNFSTLAF